MPTMHGLLAQALNQSSSGLVLRIATVSAPTSSGLNLTYQGQLITSASVLSGYSPKIGDTVACLVGGTTWLVMGAIGLLSDIGANGVDLSYSDGAPPGSDWTKSASGDLYVKVDSDGSQHFHVVREASANPPPPRDVTDVVSITPNASGSYANGDRNGYFDDTPVQGSWSGAANTGAWVYGTKISDACAGRTVGQLTMEVARKNDGSGVWGPVPMRLYLITNGTLPNSTPTLAMGWTPAVRLGPGDELRGRNAITIPAAQRDALATGQYSGIACYTSNHKEYIVYGTCGKLYATLH